jgi:ribose transport system permease protein
MAVSNTISSHGAWHRRLLSLLARYGLILALVIVSAIFSATTPSFLTAGNLQSLLVNNFTLLAIVSIAMTFAVSGGGIDLSVGTAVDFASFAFVSLVLAGEPVVLGLLGGLAAGAVVGAFNALLISGIGVSPFLATLGTLFIGRSVQQLLTNGGNPVYLPPSGIPEAFRFVGHGAIAGFPVPLAIAIAVIAAAALIFARTRFGRVVLAIGIQPSVVRYSGIGLGRHVAVTFILTGLIAAIAGLILTATVPSTSPHQATRSFSMRSAPPLSARRCRHSDGRTSWEPCSGCCSSASSPTDCC